VRILVTGQDGQLVRSLSERASQATSSGFELVALGRPQLDLLEPQSISRAVEEVRPEIIINAAAYTAVDQAEDEPQLAFRVNAEAAGDLATAARSVGARFIQISTDYVYDGTRSGSYSEDAQPSPLGVYGRSKRAGEERVVEAHPDAMVVRTAWVYSPFGKNFVKTMTTLGGQRDELSVVADQTGNPSSALDLADGLLRVVEAWQAGSCVGMGETYHLAGTGVASWFDLASLVMAARSERGLPAARVRPIRTEEYPTRATRPRNSSLDSTKFARDFSFRAPPWQQSTSMVVNRLIDQGV
jgi:dTDP-4-dehydrorhamnose reductase